MPVRLPASTEPDRPAIEFGRQVVGGHDDGLLGGEQTVRGE
jgi:hypothetical protein